ncbi:MAG: hypothetical protein HWD59_07750 [Coxiellaceae bacterium]|nr:MAG: hypothetical protein HWD59_07750 [Coxiellaceae bacterium]
MSKTIGFSLSAYALAGWSFPIMLGTIFTLGMIITDGLNGYLVAYLIKGMDKWSQMTSRTIGFLIGSFSLVISIYYFFMFLTSNK